MSQALSVQRDHLRHNRRMIIGRSILASLASVVPVPLLDDQLSYVVQRSVLRKIAEAHQIDLSDDAIRALVFGESSPPSLLGAAGGALAYKLISRYGRRFIITYVTARRAQVASRYFARATLFDHYCAKLHTGLGLDADAALELRRLIDRAMDGTPGTLGTRLFRRGLLAAARASLRAPVELAQMVTDTVSRRLLPGASGGEHGEAEEVEPVEELDLALEKQLRAHDGFLARTVTAVELQVSVEGNPYLEELVDNFERLWRLPPESDERASPPDE